MRLTSACLVLIFLRVQCEGLVTFLNSHQLALWILSLFHLLGGVCLRMTQVFNARSYNIPARLAMSVSVTVSRLTVSRVTERVTADRISNRVRVCFRVPAHVSDCRSISLLAWPCQCP